MIISDTNYGLTIHNIDKVKIALEALDKTICLHIPQGITNEYDKSRDLLINLLEEAEFTISTYKTYNCE